MVWAEVARARDLTAWAGDSLWTESGVREFGSFTYYRHLFWPSEKAAEPCWAIDAWKLFRKPALDSLTVQARKVRKAELEAAVLADTAKRSTVADRAVLSTLLAG